MSHKSISDGSLTSWKVHHKTCHWHSVVSHYIYALHYNDSKDIFAPNSVFSHFVCTLHFCAQKNWLSADCAVQTRPKSFCTAPTPICPPTCTHLHASALPPYRTRLTTWTVVPPAHYGIGGADFLSEQQIFLPPYTFFSDWHKWYGAPGTSTSADGSADKIRLCLHYFLHW